MPDLLQCYILRIMFDFFVCLFQANGEDLLGLKIVDIAKRVRNSNTTASPAPGVSLMLWNSGFEKNVSSNTQFAAQVYNLFPFAFHYILSSLVVPTVANLAL